MKILTLLGLLLCMAMPAYAENNEAEKSKAKEGKEDKAAVGDKSGYVNLAPLVLPVLGENGPEQLVNIIITLEMNDPEKSDEVKLKMPRLRDAYLQTLYGALDTRSVNRGSLVDITQIKRRLQAPTERVLGKGLVKEILVQAVAQRRL